MMLNVQEKEGNVLVNDTLNTFLIRLYGIRHMVNDNSVREESHFCHYMDYSFQLVARDLLYTSPYRNRIAHTTSFVTPVVEHWPE